MYFSEEKGPVSPEEEGLDFLSSISFWWLDTIIFQEKTITYEDLYRRADYDQTKTQYKKLEEAEKVCISESDIENGVYRLWTCLFYIYGWTLLKMCLYNLAEIACNFTAPFALEELILFIEGKTEYTSIHWGLMWSYLLLFAPSLRSIIDHQYMYQILRIFLNSEAAISGKVFRKVLKMNSIAKSGIKTGEMVNLMSVDAFRVGSFFSWINFGFQALLTIIIASYLIWYKTGLAAFFGLSCMALIVPLSIYFGKKFSDAEEEMMKHKDERVKVINEMLLGIRVVKFFTWEKKFREKINHVRHFEAEELKKAGIFDSLNVVALRCIPVVGSVLTFISFALMGGKLEPSQVFATISLFNILNLPLYNSSYFIVEFVNGYVSAKRLNKFFSSEELEDYSKIIDQKKDEIKEEKKEEKKELIPLIPKDVPKDKMIVSQKELPKGGVEIKDGYFCWDKKALTLKNINLTIKPGQLVCVIGEVGSGKSSLLNVIFDNMLKLKGNVKVNGSLAYCCQTPWMINATLKDNILFGREYDEELYHQVIKSCALVKDLEQLPDGDETEIGENGINVSGGQKHRVSLARACYSESDIYLLDSPLAAVDVHVAKKLFQSCINGFLKGKTVVLVTHSLQFLHAADVIIVMKGGRIHSKGTFNELKKIDPSFEKLMSETDEEKDKFETEEIKQKKNEPEKGSLIQDEEKQMGSLPFSVYVDYFKGYGFWFWLCCITAVASKASYLGSGAWLSVWSQDSWGLDEYVYMLVYILLAISNVGNVFAQRMFFIYGGLRSAISLHSDMLYSVLRSPMSFFDTTPTGRILNRFAEDQTRVDQQLGYNFSYVFEYVCELVGTILLVAVIAPPNLLMIIPVCVIYYFIQKAFRYPYREVKRFVEMSRSPLFAHFSACIAGTSTIRAYNLQEQFIKENEERIDYHQRSRWMELVMNRWISLRLELLSAVIVFGTALFGVLLRNYLNPSLVGYAVTYSLTISENFNWAVRTFILCESGLINVERIQEYSKLKPEAPLLEEKRPPKNWPKTGEIRFENLQMRYREGLDLVLKGLDAVIKPNEKIGIVGRTGSGKSTLLLVLFRMVELCGGKLIIDDLDVSTIGLYDLRRNLSIIPQDPTIFSGNLRTNIDPFNNYTDKEIWDALESCHLKDKVENLKGKLEEVVDESGQNLSVGERQLLCLCRSVLANKKIVVLDEATANVDHASDHIIQKTIRERFKNKTVITIAHRLDTIMDCDRVMVMAFGKILEFDNPHLLIKEGKGQFAEMVEQTGEYASVLKEMAEKGYNENHKK